jgi:hypothetical protein
MIVPASGRRGRGQGACEEPEQFGMQHFGVKAVHWFNFKVVNENNRLRIPKVYLNSI